MHISAFRNFALAGAALLSLFPGCASKPPAGGPGTYRGVLAGMSEIGTVDVTVEEAASGPLPAIGTIDFGSTVVSLSGTLDQSNASISLSSTDGYHLRGDSRPTYVLGSYQGPQDAGKYALFLEAVDSGSIRLFCGSFVDTGKTAASATPYPFAVTVMPSGSAFCVTQGFTWFGNLDANDTLSCESGSGLFAGNANADAGNQWGMGVDKQGNGNYGTWTVVPCGGSTSPGPDGGASGADDAALD
jgi:hypothetical protein